MCDHTTKKKKYGMIVYDERCINKSGLDMYKEDLGRTRGIIHGFGFYEEEREANMHWRE